MAMEDIAQMRAEGVAVSDRDVIRLNALALRCKKSPDTASSVCLLPRVAFLGDVAIREPSIAAELWLADAGRHFDCSDDSTYMALRAFSVSRDPSDLPDALDLDAVRKAVKAFVRKEIGAYTVRQLDAALEYAINGASDAAGEYPAPDPDKAESEKPEGDQSFAAGVLCDGVALRLGPMSELARLTESGLGRLIARHLESKGGGKEEGMQAFMEYERTKDEIRGRNTPT